MSTETLEAHVGKKYEVSEKLGKGVSVDSVVAILDRWCWSFPFAQSERAVDTSDSFVNKRAPPPTVDEV
jgi:hypothetical protein